MSGSDYFPLGEGGPLSSLLPSTSALRLAGGLAGLVLTSLAAFSASVRHNSGQTPFVPKEGIENVLVRPGPPGGPLLLAPVPKPPTSPACIFFLPQELPDPDAETLMKDGRSREAWLYGATSGGAGLGMATGRPEDVLRGRLVCWDKEQLQTRLAAADQHYRYKADGVGTVGRAAVFVVEQNGRTKQAYWYFRSSAPAVSAENAKKKTKKESAESTAGKKRAGPATSTRTSKRNAVFDDAWLSRWPGWSASQAKALEETSRWAQHFVQTLGLCPWAGPSLAKPGMVEYVWTDATDGEAMTKAVLKAANELVAAYATRDPLLAITFVVAPHFLSSPSDFARFFNWLMKLEDDTFGLTPVLDVLDETDLSALGRAAAVPTDLISFSFDDLQQDVLGDWVIAAGFHPHWTWAGEPADSTVHFDKRSPHPTVSLIHASTIEGAELATARIAIDNAIILSKFSSQQLQERLAQLLLSDPFNS
eukprot:gb/GEZN01005383.1/.p1 GENE.gb/GEZN01005383.1/~~gb/GEZN01005383.1/.p1  ORF type:complete len:477 (+),score=69.30 gb/GEZN01005383.1/:133-1563(+)